MAYIQPNSTVEFFADIGIDPSYENTLYFSSVSAKDNYFSNLTKIATATALSYSRESRGFIRVEKPMSTMIRAGYMRFKNTSFENKWWYAFVTSVEYINNVTTQVNFVLDVMMTWMGSFTLGECFVERMHSATDAIGDNIIDENLEIGDYIYQAVERTNLMGSYTIIIGASVNDNGESVAGGTMMNNIYSGIVLHQFGTVEAANVFIDKLTEKAKSDALVACVMCPSQFIVTSGSSTGQVIHISKNTYNLDGYIPKNKKLFTYPYNYLVVTNGNGNFATFRYEFFMASGTDCAFVLSGVAGLQPEAVLVPQSYKKATSQIFNTAEKLTITGFPQCAFNIDQYKAFLAQNSSSITADVISTTASGVIDVATGVATLNLGGALSGASRIANMMAKYIDYSKKPTQSHGTQCSNFLASNRQLDFFFYKQCITAEYAKTIDDYFTMFGYAQRKCMIPNMNVRPHWTYVKTVGCVVNGQIPADDARKIEEIFDSGIRFWKDYMKIGHYSLYNNAPA